MIKDKARGNDMRNQIKLEHFLATRARQQAVHEDLASIIEVIASTGASMAKIISRLGLEASSQPSSGDNPDYDPGQPLEKLSQQAFIDALSRLPLSFIASEKSDDIIEIDGVRVR